MSSFKTWGRLTSDPRVLTCFLPLLNKMQTTQKWATVSTRMKATQTVSMRPSCIRCRWKMSPRVILTKLTGAAPTNNQPTSFQLELFQWKSNCPSLRGSMPALSPLREAREKSNRWIPPWTSNLEGFPLHRRWSPRACRDPSKAQVARVWCHLWWALINQIANTSPICRRGYSARVWAEFQKKTKWLKA